MSHSHYVSCTCTYASPLSDHGNAPFRLSFTRVRFLALWLRSPNPLTAVTAAPENLVCSEEPCIESGLLWHPGRRRLRPQGPRLSSDAGSELPAGRLLPPCLLPVSSLACSLPILIKAVAQSPSHPPAPPPPLFMALPVALILMCRLLAG